jgi:hypothetical protein
LEHPKTLLLFSSVAAAGEKSQFLRHRNYKGHNRKIEANNPQLIDQNLPNMKMLLGRKRRLLDERSSLSCWHV